VLTAAVLVVQLAVATAPADQYFGKLKMSALRIRYETMQLRKRYETHELLPEQTEHLLLLTEDAFNDWARAYPKDPWLASTGYAIATLYGELPGTTARGHAVALLLYVKTHFPNSTYAASSRAALHRGVPTRPDPPWAKAMRAAMPSPSPSVRPAMTTEPSVVPSAAPSTSPSPAPSPAATRAPGGAQPRR
jgi:hypothetical protein